MTATDIRRHAQRANMAAGARPIETFGAGELPNRRVPPDLDPRAFAHRTGITNEDRDQDEVLASVFGAAHQLHRGLDAIYARERAIMADGTRTPAEVKRLVGKMVAAQSREPLQANTAAYHTLRKALADLEADLQNAFRSRLPREDAAELRAVLRGMPKKARTDCLAAAKAAGDFDVIAAVLAAKPVVSGLTAAEAASWRREYEQAHHAPELARREKLKKAWAETEALGQLFVRETLAMVDHEQLSEIEAARTAADQAAS